MQTVADNLGLSVSTVSLALRNSELIAEATRTRVAGEAKRLGYVYNRRAANLRTQSRDVIGLVVPDIASPFVGLAAGGLQGAVASAGKIVALANTRESVETQTSVIQALLEENVAGIVLIPALGTTRADLELLQRMGTPTVLMNRSVPGNDFRLVDTDHAAVVELALAHALEVHGARSVAYFGGFTDAKPVIQRKQAFEKAAAEAGVRIAGEWHVSTGAKAQNAYETALPLVENAPLPDMILCHSDAIAFGLFAAIHERAVQADQCSIMGIDGIDAAALFTPALTTVSVQAAALGMAAGALLSGSAAQPVREPRPQLVVRRSCGCAGERFPGS